MNFIYIYINNTYFHDTEEITESKLGKIKRYLVTDEMCSLFSQKH